MIDIYDQSAQHAKLVVGWPDLYSVLLFMQDYNRLRSMARLIIDVVPDSTDCGRSFPRILIVGMASFVMNSRSGEMVCVDHTGKVRSSTDDNRLKDRPS